MRLLGGDVERLSIDDQAQALADLFTARALAEQQAEAAKAPKRTPGVCSNCGGSCVFTAVYCDQDCRDDHEARMCKRARTTGS